jgi:hypothetical protein
MAEGSLCTENFRIGLLTTTDALGHNGSLTRMILRTE